MSRHEPCAPHEIFVGNTRREGGSFPYLASKLRSVRLGSLAYCIEGKALPSEYAPIFIHRNEMDAHHAAMMYRAFGENWRRAS